LQTNAFDETEAFTLLDAKTAAALGTGLPLSTNAISCDQGWSNDMQWNCTTKTISHQVCGHFGTVSLSSPEYEVWENAGTIRVTVNRSGGGVGEISVRYGIHHLTTSDHDLTSTNFYTTDQKVVFSPGEVQKSFLVTINDDREVEGNERFEIILLDASVGAVLVSFSLPLHHHTICMRMRP